MIDLGTAVTGFAELQNRLYLGLKIVKMENEGWKLWKKQGYPPVVIMGCRHIRGKEELHLAGEKHLGGRTPSWKDQRHLAPACDIGFGGFSIGVIRGL